MVELIDKKNLFNNLFVRNGKVCPNSDIDNFPTTIDVKEVKKVILEQPTTTEAEIRASSIDEFAEKLLEEVEANPVDVGGRYSYMIPQSFLEGQIKDIAEQLKERE